MVKICFISCSCLWPHRAPEARASIEVPVSVAMATMSGRGVKQVKLTNVAIVRLKKGGKRFELACYPNKVTRMDYVASDLSSSTFSPYRRN